MSAMSNNVSEPQGRPTNSGLQPFKGVVLPPSKTANVLQDRASNWNFEHCIYEAPLKRLLVRYQGKLAALFDSQAASHQPEASNAQSGSSQGGKKKKSKGKGKGKAKASEPKAIVRTETRGFRHYPDVLAISFKNENNEPIELIPFPMAGCTLNVKLRRTSYTIDITSKVGDEIQDQWVFEIKFSTPKEAKQCKEVWSHLVRSFTTMSPAIVEYVNLPRHPTAVAAEGTDAGRQDPFPPIEILIPGFRSLQLTNHVADPYFQNLVKHVLGGPFPGDSEPGRQDGEGSSRGGNFVGGTGDHGGEGPSGQGVSITSTDVHGAERGKKSGQRSVKKTAKAAQKAAARQRRRQEWRTNPAGVELRRSARLAQKPDIDYGPLRSLP